jgi:hypothetical protein
MTEASLPYSSVVAERLKESDRIVHWVHSKLNGTRIPQLPDDKRAQLSCACWSVTVEHSMAIVVLVHESLFGSALALIRPMFEAYVRGTWLKHAASDDDVDRAGRDQFPNDFDRLVTELEKTGHAFSNLKQQSWKQLCSFTHTGYRQIGARLSAEGIGSYYSNEEITEALLWADIITLNAVLAFANLRHDEPLIQEIGAYFATLARAVEAQVAAT